MIVRKEQCKDGSDTVFSEKFGQFYHNPNGAVSESIHIFFETSGLIREIESGKSLRILEIGFGTGLNALLLADIIKSSRNTNNFIFQSIEAWPISAAFASDLNYAQFLKNPEIAGNLPKIFTQLESGNAELQLLGNLQIKVFKGFFANFSPDAHIAPFDFVFHDAFSPEVNSELWSEQVFKKIHQFCSDEAVLTTYCAATAARAAMARGGWYPARAQGALGKREMTIASKNPEKLRDFKQLNVKKWL